MGGNVAKNKKEKKEKKNRVYRKRATYALSAKDIRTILESQGLNPKILLYKDLKGYDLDSFAKDLASHVGLVILMPTLKSNFGHWVCIFFREDKLGRLILSFFDPYGTLNGVKLLPDSELDWNQSGVKYPPYLTRLLLQYDDAMEFNEVKLQHLSDDISTCGRWCCFRLMNKDMSEKEFADNVRRQVERGDLTADEMVTKITDNYL